MRKLVALAFSLLATLPCGCAHSNVGYYRFDEVVTRESAKNAVQAIQRAEHDHVQTLVIDINSPGGSVTSGFEVSKAIENSTVDIVCVADGEADSMAFYILQSCPVRMMTKRTVLMTHEPSVAAPDDFSGNATQWEKVVQSLRALANAMAEHCANRLKITVAQYKEKIAGDKDWWLNWKEALQVGAVDEVVSSVGEVIARYQ